MSTARWVVLGSMIALFGGCDSDAPSSDAGVDAARPDAARPDASTPDAARDGGHREDAGPDDGGADAAAEDAGTDGGSPSDAGPPDPDPDEDGFDTEREIACGTDPMNGADHPSATELRGSGTEADPYRICLPEHLALYAGVAGVSAAHARLGDDLDASGVALGAPIGSSEEPFVATFDGAGHTVAGLVVGASGDARPGLFAWVGAGGVVRDLTLRDAVSFAGSPLVDRNGGTIQRVRVHAIAAGGDHVGLVANTNLAGGVIEGCESGGSVTATNSHVGGVVGENLGIVRRSFSTASVAGQHRTGGLVGSSYGAILESWAGGTATGTGRWIGGLVGTARTGSVVADSYALGDVSAAMSTAGGVVGNAEGDASIARVYARNTVTAPMPSGVVGEDTNAMAVVTGCYFDRSLTSTDARCTALEPGDMARAESFPALDFDATWTIDLARRGSPILRWE